MSWRRRKPKDPIIADLGDPPAAQLDTSSAPAGKTSPGAEPGVSTVTPGAAIPKELIPPPPPAATPETPPPPPLPDELYLLLLDTPPRMYGLMCASRLKRPPIPLPPLSPAQIESLRPLVPILRKILPRHVILDIIIFGTVYSGILADRFGEIARMYAGPQAPKAIDDTAKPAPSA